MKYEIRHRFTNELLYEHDGASLREAVVAARNAMAYLRGAYLRGAYLRGAYLRGAIGANRHLLTPRLMLLDQPDFIRAYKLVNAAGEGPFNGGIKYQAGGEYSVDAANTDELTQCGAGINVATLDWCIKEWREGYRILIAEFKAADIACIPTATDGKFRLRRCRIVGEKDLAEIGLVKAETTSAGDS